MALQMMVEVGLVHGVIAPMTPNGAGSIEREAVVAGDRLRDEVLDAGRLLGDEVVLDDLVLDAPEAGLLVGRLGERRGVLEHGGADRRDDLARRASGSATNSGLGPARPRATASSTVA